jgi:uncharacterized Zn finger protein
MSRESADAKARRYLSEGRVTVVAVAVEHVDAIVKGDAALWRVTYRRGGWHCPCPAKGRCAHLLALGLIVAPAKETAP